MHQKIIAALLIVFAAALGLDRGKAWAQDNSLSTVPAYHLDFTLVELEDGKKINSRQYAMDSIAERPTNVGRDGDFGAGGKEIKIGTRVPVETEQGKVEYVDIGTRIWNKLVLNNDGQLLSDVRAEVSSLVPRTDTDVYRPSSHNPILRQLSIQSSTAITVGKPTSLGTVEDPDSKRQFQLEMTVTKLR
jgi:hypothetical protein